MRKFHELSRKTISILAIGIFIAALVATVGVFAAIRSLTSQQTSAVDVPIASAEGLEKDAYATLGRGDKEQALDLFKRSLTLSQSEGRSEDSIRSTKDQIEFLELDIKNTKEVKTQELQSTPGAYVTEKMKDGSTHITPANQP